MVGVIVGLAVTAFIIMVIEIIMILSSGDEDVPLYILLSVVSVILVFLAGLLLGGYLNAGRATNLDQEKVELGKIYQVLGHGNLQEYFPNNPTGSLYWSTVIGPDGYVYTFIGTTPIPDGKVTVMLNDEKCSLVSVSPLPEPATQTAETGPPE